MTSAQILERAPRSASTDRPTTPATDRGQARLIAFSSGLGFLFDAYVVNIYSFVLPLIVVSFSFSSTAAGVIGSVMLAGYTLGTFAFGWAADRFGRKDTLGASIVLYGTTTALSGLAGTAAMFAALRFLTGLGGAGELSSGSRTRSRHGPRGAAPSEPAA